VSIPIEIIKDMILDTVDHIDALAATGTLPRGQVYMCMCIYLYMDIYVCISICICDALAVIGILLRGQVIFTVDYDYNYEDDDLMFP
jgi:hypothetical protein